MEVIRLVSQEDVVPEGYEVVYSAFITLRNGHRLYAKAYGLKAWRLVVRKK
jgi:hypothetical protein